MCFSPSLGASVNRSGPSDARPSDDKIVGEVRNLVFGTRGRGDYAIVASGGFFTVGKKSFVVPIRLLKVTQERDSFFLHITEAAVTTVPLMPDQNYAWHADLRLIGRQIRP